MAALGLTLWWRRVILAVAAIAMLRLAWSNQQAAHQRPVIEVARRPGPWWRANISNVLFAPAHILIRFREAEQIDHDWTVPGEPPGRTENEARQLASEIYYTLRSHPEKFAEVARARSEDAGSAPLGGRLGVWRAPGIPPAIVDTLGRLQPNEISAPVQTSLGFHILKRFGVPPEAHISGSELVIRYRGLRSAPLPGREINRSREDARELAWRLRRKLDSHPSNFVELVREFSDAPSAAQDGDIGEWSTYELHDNLTVMALASVELGNLIGPIDDAVSGFRIAVRTAPARQLLSASVILIGYRPETPQNWTTDPSIARSRAEALRAATELQATLLEKPELFEDLRRNWCDYELCRSQAIPHREGRSPWAGLDRELVRILPGAITRKIVETPDGFAIARREPTTESGLRPIPPPEFELPRPPPITLSSATSAEFATYVEQFRLNVRRAVALDDKEWLDVEAVVRELEGGLPTEEPNRRGAIIANARNDLRDRLGAAKFQQIEDFARRLNDELQGVP